MPPAVALDGAVVPRERALVSVYDRGFLYGDTVFETLRVYGGRPHRLGLHLDRLASSAELVGIALGATREQLEREVADVLAASGEADAVVRVTLSRGEGPWGLDPTAAVTPRRVTFVEPAPPAPLAAWSRGLSVHLVATRRAADLVPEAKTGAYLDAVVALRRARAVGADDAIVVDPAGRVVEGTTSNVFVVPRGADGGALWTPPEGALLPGITRSIVIELARAAGLRVEERPVEVVDLREASEVLLTSSVREIAGVVEIDGAPVGGGAPGPVTRRLHAAYREDAGAPPLSPT